MKKRRRDPSQRITEWRITMDWIKIRIYQIVPRKKSERGRFLLRKTTKAMLGILINERTNKFDDKNK